MADAAPQENSRILIYAGRERSLNESPRRGFAKRRVTDSFSEALFRGRPQVMCLYRDESNQLFTDGYSFGAMKAAALFISKNLKKPIDK